MKYLKSGVLLVIAIVSLVASDAVLAGDGETRGDSTRVKNKNGDASWSVWGNQNSNVISTGFISSIALGGFISHDILDPVLDVHKGGMGAFGGSIGWEREWAAKPFGKGDWALCGSHGSEVLYDASWTSDLFELVWYGNGGHTGRVDALSGTGVRAGVFNRFGLGLESISTRQRLEISLVQRLAGFEWSVPYGYFWVSENADSLDTYIQSEARLHASYDTTAAAGSQLSLLPAYGIGISGRLPLASETLPIRFEINFKDLGVLFEPEGSSVAWFSEGIATTGLPVLGDSLTWESVLDEGVSTDSIILTGNSVKRMTLLPSKLSANIIYEPSPDVMIEMSISSGGWMPEPLYTAGVGWKPIDKIAFGVEARYGGWGGMRPAVWAQWRFSCRRMLVVEVENPIGLFLGADMAEFSYGRGVTVRLERLAGSGWSALGGRFKSVCK